MAFKKGPAPELRAETPEKLFPLLPRTGENSEGLWSQQTDLMRAYISKRVTAKDLSIELPTGTGKTLTGLLIADWRRREGKGRAIFACPTRQLVKQVIQAAAKEGIPVVDLSGPSGDWDASAKTSYERARAVAVTTYSAIFNTSPKLIDADVIVFDDAHAGEQYVSHAYTVEVSRAKHNDIYTAVLEAVRSTLSPDRYSQLIMNNPGSGTRELVDALFLAQHEDWIEPLSNALNLFGKKDDGAARSAMFAHRAIDGHLSSCTLYLSWNRMEIRPATPPTFENTLFTNANQRIYLSATMGAAGELERAFGRPSIKKLSLPPEAPTPRSGRRFLVFPHHVDGVDPEAFTKKLLAKMGKAVIIAPSDHEAEKAEEVLVPDAWSVFHKGDVEESFDAFASATDAAAVLANRYDGIDLPGDACRAVTLYGFPGTTNLQERFYKSRARSSSVTDERVRSRVVQGIGRCTRHRSDWALVVIADSETTTYLSRPEVTRAFPPELQAEIQFGLEQSETTPDEVLENVDAFLEQGTNWRDNAEKDITTNLTSVRQVVPGAADALARAARFEVESLESQWHEDWKTAADKLHDAATALGSAQDARGYRATLLFRAAVLMDKAGRLREDPALASAADALADQAVRAATPATWMNSYLPFAGRTAMTAGPAFTSAVVRLSAYISDVGTPARLSQIISETISGLGAIDHGTYEPALSALGKLVGADASKPTGDARTDSQWCWDDHLWLSLEAKSEHVPAGLIGADDVRQVNGHLDLVAHDRGVAAVPTGSAAVMISPRTLVNRTAMALAEPGTWRVTPANVLGLAVDVERLWSHLQTLRTLDVKARRAPVAEALKNARLTPEDIVDRLTLTPLGDENSASE